MQQPGSTTRRGALEGRSSDGIRASSVRGDDPHQASRRQCTRAFSSTIRSPSATAIEADTAVSSGPAPRLFAA